MASTLQLITQITRSVNNVPSFGSLPQTVSSVASTSDLMYGGTQVVGFAAEEPLAIGDVTDEAMAIIINNDPTNFVEVGYGAFTAFIKIPPGETCVMPRATSLAAIKLKADTAAVNVTVLLFKIS